MPNVHATAEAGAGRLGRSRRVATSLSEINVVPLVDVMLVLLIIFMVTAPLIQRGIDVNLPVAQRAAAIPAVLFYNHLTNRVKLFASEMDDFAMEFLNIAERNFT